MTSFQLVRPVTCEHMLKVRAMVLTEVKRLMPDRHSHEIHAEFLRICRITGLSLPSDVFPGDTQSHPVANPLVGNPLGRIG